MSTPKIEMRVRPVASPYLPAVVAGLGNNPDNPNAVPYQEFSHLFIVLTDQNGSEYVMGVAGADIIKPYGINTMLPYQSGHSDFARYQVVARYDGWDALEKFRSG